MNWYVVKIIFRIISGNGDHCAQFDEQLRLISAANETDAYEKAAGIGRDNQDSFLNSRGETVQWLFVNVAEINPLPILNDGVELYYQIHETADAETYLNWAHQKSALLEQ